MEGRGPKIQWLVEIFWFEDENLQRDDGLFEFSRSQ